MIEISRAIFKADPVFRELWSRLAGNHKTAEHDAKLLFENKHVKDFCVQSRYFLVMPGKHAIYLHYDTSSWYNGRDGALVKIESIGIYDSFQEYEVARMRELHGPNKGADIPNIN